uniref:Uncharacterized protein n=1 Tax=Oryza meridionalis TaxID=40149 RepID=A0A0E0CYL1_9ORYZ
MPKREQANKTAICACIHTRFQMAGSILSAITWIICTLVAASKPVALQRSPDNTSGTYSVKVQFVVDVDIAVTRSSAVAFGVASGRVFTVNGPACEPDHARKVRSGVCSSCGGTAAG